MELCGGKCVERQRSNRRNNMNAVQRSLTAELYMTSGNKSLEEFREIIEKIIELELKPVENSDNDLLNEINNKLDGIMFRCDALIPEKIEIADD
jgi:hypothetical protein